MTNTKMIAIFSEVIPAGICKAFRYKLTYPNAQMIGLMHSNNSTISLSFQNHEALEIENLSNIITDTLELPPSERIVSWDKPIAHCSYVSGSLINTSKHEKQMNIYVLIQQL